MVTVTFDLLFLQLHTYPRILLLLHFMLEFLPGIRLNFKPAMCICMGHRPERNYPGEGSQSCGQEASMRLKTKIGTTALGLEK